MKQLKVRFTKDEMAFQAEAFYQKVITPAIVDLHLANKRRAAKKKCAKLRRKR